MDQKFEGTPRAEIRLEGDTLVRSGVTHDWGLRLQWKITAAGKVVATPSARGSDRLETRDLPPGEYSVVLQMWHYVNYKKRADGDYVDSKYVDVSNVVALTK